MLSPTTSTKVGSAVFCGSALLLFATSAIYHTGTWSPRVWAVLRRFDHANIFLLIAGSYTPFSLILLEGIEQAVLLIVVWAGAILGVLFRVFWTDAPRWLYTPIYIALGWAAVFFIPGFFEGATDLGLGIGIAIFVLITTGGFLYTRGRRGLRLQAPQPLPPLLRLPRGVPQLHHPRVHRALRRRLAGDVLAALTLGLRPPVKVGGAMGQGMVARTEEPAVRQTRARPSLPGSSWWASVFPRFPDTVTVGLLRHGEVFGMTTYPQEFKDQLVALHRSGRTYMELGKEFNLAPTSISNWVRRGLSVPSGPPPASRRAVRRVRTRRRFAQLEKELAEKSEEVEILGKAVAFFGTVRTGQ